MRLVLDALAYHGLPIHTRDQFDAWMAEEGIDHAHIFAMELGEGFVIIGRYLLDEGRRYIDQTTGDAAREYVKVPISTLPPAEAFE